MKLNLLLLLVVNTVVSACINTPRPKEDVLLRVTGNANNVDLYYRRSEDLPYIDLINMDLPWETTLTNVDTDKLLSFGVYSLDGRTKTIRCEVVVDGQLVEKMEKNDPFTFVTCTTILSEVLDK